jgi:hypothetical protein
VSKWKCTSGHGEISEFIEAVEADDGIEVKAPMTNLQSIQFSHCFLNAYQKVPDFCL